MKLAYLDQNILVHIGDEDFVLPELEDVVWLYSTEHLNEISRGGDTSLLSVLQELKAQEIEVVSDEQWRITDQATLHNHACPFKRYREHLANVNEIPFDHTLLTDLIARSAGADNFESVQALPRESKTS
jgi:hypothetical protein